MRLPVEIREEAALLRRRGYSIKEIAQKLGIAKSTSSLWLREIKLNKKALKRLGRRKILGQYNARTTILMKKEIKNQKRLELTRNLLTDVQLSKEHLKLLCSLLYWCEGNKDDSSVRFTNSDPSLIKIFINLLRSTYKLDETKFRILMHLHSYHKEKQQKEFWSSVTGIPKTQFNKSYLKPNTGKRIHENYPGCIAVYYHNVEVARELKAIYNTFVSFRGVG